MSKRIAWIEDDAYIIGSVARLLEERGFEFLYLYSMAEALQAIEDLKAVDLILLDVLLPAGIPQFRDEHYVGLALMRELRAKGVNAPVIAFTIVPNSNTWSQLRELGVSRILPKPILPQALEEAVLAVLAA